MSEFITFDWDNANREHTSRHGVSPAEVEQVLANDPLDLEAQVAHGEERFISVGHTNQVRVLVVVWTMRGAAIRPITAFDASDALTRRYLRERGL